MNERERHASVFGRLDTLSQRMPWTSGVDNLFEWLTWNTGNVLGISKTAYWKLIVRWLHETQTELSSLQDQYKYVSARLGRELKASESHQPYERANSAIVSPCEALRRAKYFSEDYLNKEYDIFMSLVSDDYLNTYYGQFTSLSHTGPWFVHGNSQYFANSLNMQWMQIDNIAYCPDAKVVVANELKLGGKKNPDQILKYARFALSLAQSGFISKDDQMILLFIGDSQKHLDWQMAIDEEIRLCEKDEKKSEMLLAPEVVQRARDMHIVSTAWEDVHRFNESYRQSLDPQTQQVEIKLLWGFNETLRSKAVMQVA